MLKIKSEDAVLSIFDFCFQTFKENQVNFFFFEIIVDNSFKLSFDPSINYNKLIPMTNHYE